MINVNNLVYTYQGSDKPAVRGIDFAVEPGEIFGFLGPSGAGKSTTQKILIGLLKGYEGDVRVFDPRCWRVGRGAVRAHRRFVRAAQPLHQAHRPRKS